MGRHSFVDALTGCPRWRWLLVVLAPAIAIALPIGSVALRGAAGAGAGPASWQDDLAPISAADWDYQKAAHLLERAGFGGTPAEVEHLAAMTPAAAVDWLVDYRQHPDTLETNPLCVVLMI